MLALGIKDRPFRITVYQSAVTKDRHIHLAKTILKVKPFLLSLILFTISYHVPSACSRKKRNLLEKCVLCGAPGLRKTRMFRYNDRTNMRDIQIKPMSCMLTGTYPQTQRAWQTVHA